MSERCSDIVQIDSRADVIIFSSSVVTAKMDLMQRFFGFEQYIRAGAQKTIEIIRDLDIVDSLEKFVAFENKSKLTNAKKLLKAKNSPVLQMKKNDLLENLKKHSRYKTMFKFEEDHSLLDELEMRWEDEQKLNGLSSVHSMGFRQFIFYLAHKVDFIAEIFLCTMILFGNVGAQPAASFLLKFASFAKFLKQPESLCCFCTNQIFNFFSCNTAVFQCILKNE